MVPVICLSVFAEDGLSVLDSVLSGYSKHKSFRCTLVHHGDSGLYPEPFEQEFRWKSGNRFELKVTKHGKGRRPGDFYSDGKFVVSVFPDRLNMREPIDHGKNNSPAWEVTGGPIMMWVIDSPGLDLFRKLRPGMQVTYKVEQSRKFHGQEALPIVFGMKYEREARQAEATFFVSLDRQRFIGMEWVNAGKPGYLLVTNQKFDIPLPANLGDAPKKY